jgi:hypothetical protein
MTRAVATFTVAVQRRRVRVRVLETVRDLDRKARVGLAQRLSGQIVCGYFDAHAPGARWIGTIVLAADRLCPEFISHEATHAAVHAERLRSRGSVDVPLPIDEHAEERIATFAGLLCQRITRRLNEVLA